MVSVGITMAFQAGIKKIPSRPSMNLYCKII